MATSNIIDHERELLHPNIFSHAFSKGLLRFRAGFLPLLVQLELLNVLMLRNTWRVELCKSISARLRIPSGAMKLFSKFIESNPLFSRSASANSMAEELLMRQFARLILRRFVFLTVVVLIKSDRYQEQRLGLYKA
jgi:hypothetical protein